jgi:ankyrin repeat protein
LDRYDLGALQILAHAEGLDQTALERMAKGVQEDFAQLNEAIRSHVNEGKPRFSLLQKAAAALCVEGAALDALLEKARQKKHADKQIAVTDEPIAVQTAPTLPTTPPAPPPMPPKPVNPLDHLTPLMKAARDGDIKAILALLREGANPNERDSSAERQDSFSDTVELLLEKGANGLGVKVNGSWTPLHYAVSTNQTEATRILLDAGADIEAKDIDEWTPLYVAAWNGAKEAATLLLDWGASQNIRSSSGWTPLHAAAGWNRYQVAQLLLDRGANIEAKDSDHWTPLYVAAWNGSTETAKCLLSHKANPNPTASNGWTPLHGAAQEGNTELVKLLLQYGANPNALSKSGKTPRDQALKNKRTEVAEMLP